MTEPSADKLRSIFKYNPHDGTLIYLKGARAGKKVGWVDTLGYNRAWVENKKYSCSKIVWAMMTGAFPERRLYTRDKNRLNLKWNNLAMSRLDKDMRLPRINVTAVLMGDPPPGRSMLDGYKHASDYNAARSMGKPK